MDRFVEEIDFAELRFLEIVGRGAFGVVRSAIWKGINVAVKHIETEAERKAFATELAQLSRVCHPNIVKLYGACTKNPVCLVMEYAEGGSLYNVLHSTDGEPAYTLAHAVSWCLQCAQGVDYLHSMKPKALIHRDLKPPNLLLVHGATVLKICDFGTACDQHTYMTNNKGSAAWMAPEVFEGSSYSEKCDVFSWGIILWEVLTRRKPFEELGGPAFRIMWAVHNGTRPPLITGCPTALDKVMTRCWATNPLERPSMSEVVRVMSCIIKFLPGADVPLKCSASSPSSTSPPTHLTVQGAVNSSGFDTMHETLTTGVRAIQPGSTGGQLVAGVEAVRYRAQVSAPPSLAASLDNLPDRIRAGSGSRSSTPSDFINKRYSADLSQLDISSPPASVKGHRRTGSHGNAPFLPPVTDETLPHLAGPIRTVPDELGRVGGFVNRTSAWTNPGVATMTPAERVALNFEYSALDHQLQPLAPCPTCPESYKIYEEHVRLAEEYRQVQMEIYLLTQKKTELESEFQRDEEESATSARRVEEYFELQGEHESLKSFCENLKTQVALYRNPSHIRTTNNI